MPIETYNPNAVNGISALPSTGGTTPFTIETKINNLQQAVQDKTNGLAQTRGQEIAQNIEAMGMSGYKSGMLQEIPDADSPVLVGDTTGRRLGGDPIRPNDPSGWVDAPEVFHGDFSNTPKEQARIERQREQYGLASKEDVFREGERARLEALYNMMGRPKDSQGNEWTPGPIEYDTPLVLGDKENPLNIPVQVKETGDVSHGRKVTYVTDSSGKVNQSAQLARAGQLAVKDTKVDSSKQDAYKEYLALVGQTADRSIENMAKDTGLQLVSGSLNFTKNLGDMYGLITGNTDNFVSNVSGKASKFYQEKYSDELKNAIKNKAEAISKGETELDKYLIGMKENLNNPMLLGQLVTESTPMMVGALAGGEALAAVTGLKAATGMVTTGALQQGTDMGTEFAERAVKVPQEYWDKNEAYKELVESGVKPEDAKKELALNLGRAVAVTSGILSFGVNKLTPGGESIEKVLTGTKAGTGLVKSILGESVTEGIEEGGGKSIQNIGLTEINPDQRISEDVGVVTADAMSVGAVTSGVVNGPGALVQATGTLKEYADNASGLEADANNDKPSVSVHGRNQRFNSDVSNVAESAKPAWTADIAKHAGELWLSDELKKDTDYVSNPVKIFKDATDKIATLNGITSEEGKKYVESQLYKNVWDLTKEKDSSGNRIIGDEQATGMLSKIVDVFKGNKLVENEVERNYKQELKDKFAEVRQRLATEGVNTDDLSDKGLLTKDELENLEKTLGNMRKLGSEPITKLANNIQETLEARQERLGSQAVDDNVPKRKNYLEVRKEIESIGFLTKGYKSLKEHANDILSYVLNENANNSDRDKTLADLEYFVSLRNGKINVFDRSGIDTRVRSIGEIKKFADITYEDNNKIIKLLNRAIAKTKNEDSKSRLVGMLGSMVNTQQELYKVIHSRNSTAGDIELYRNLLDKNHSMPKDKEFLEKYLSTYINEYKPTETETEFDIEEYIDPVEDVADEVLGKEELPASNEVDENVEDGSTDTKEIEEEAKQVEQQPSNDDVSAYKELVENAKLELNELESIIYKYRKLNREIFVEKNNIRLEKQRSKEYNDSKNIIKTLGETINKHRVRINELKNEQSKGTKELSILDRMLEEYDNELGKLSEKAKKVQDKIEKAVDEKSSIQQRMKFSYILIKEVKSLIRKLVNQLKKLTDKIKETKVGKYAVETLKREVVTDLDYINEEITNLENEISKLEEIKFDTEYTDSNTSRKDMYDNSRELNRMVEERDDKLAAMSLDIDQINETRDRIKSLKNVIREYEGKIKDANVYRNTIVNTLGEIVKPISSNVKSVTNRLMSGEEIESIMPRIVRNMENSQERIAEAVKSLGQWERGRVQQNKTEGIKKRFISQSSTDDKAILAKVGLDRMFSDENIVPMVEKAVNLTSMLTLADMIDTRRLKGEQLDEFIDGAFGKLWSEGSDTKEIDTYALKNAVRKGKLVPISTYASKAGRRLLEELEIKLNTETAQDRMDVIQALGNIVIDNILANSQTKDSFRVRKSLVGMTQNGVYVKGDNDTTNVEMPIRVLMLDGLTDNQIKKIGDSSIIFEYAREHSDGMISLTPTKFEYGKLGRNSDVPMSNSEVDYLNRQNSIEWKFSDDFSRMWETEFNKDVEALKLAIIGTKESLISKTNINEVESALAKYEADALDIERMIMAYEIANGNEFYINWDYTISNRSMMNNRMINPQNSKLSRFIVEAKDMINTLEDASKDISIKHKDLNNINLGIAQAFDLDPDKFTDETVIKKLKKEYVDISLDKDGKYTVDIKDSKLKEVIRSKDTLTAISKVMKVKPDHIMHVYQAVELIKKIKNGERLETNLALEVDGITNGMMSTVAQIGLNERTANFYIKCGTYLDGYNKVNDKEVNSHGEFKENGGVDFYQTPAESFIEELNLAKTINENPDAKTSELFNVVNYLVADNTKDKDKSDKKWRSFLKPLVMVFAYGASMYNIGLKGSDALALSIATKLRTPAEMKRAMDIFIKQDNITEAINHGNSKLEYAVRVVNTELPKISKKKLNIETGRLDNDINGEYYLDDSLRNAMTLIINESIGTKLEEVFNKEFEPITEYRKAIKAVNQINYLASKQAFKNAAKEMYGVEEYSKLTKEQERVIKDKLIKEGTYYGSYNTNGGIQDYFKTEADPNYSSETITVNLTDVFSKFYASGAGKASKVNQIVKKITSNVGAVGVIDIHSIDGSTMIKGHKKDVLNIFDALVLGTDFRTNNEQVKAMNQVYYEILMGHSVLGTAVEKVANENVQKLVGQHMQEMTQAEKEELKSDLKRIFNLKKVSKESIMKSMEKAYDTLDEVDNSRRNLVHTPAKVRQYYVGDLFEAAEWTPKELEGRYAVWSNDGNMEEREMIRFMMTELLPNMAMDPVKEKAKINDSILPAIEEGNSPYAISKLGELYDEIQC